MRLVSPVEPPKADLPDETRELRRLVVWLVCGNVVGWVLLLYIAWKVASQQ